MDNFKLTKKDLVELDRFFKSEHYQPVITTLRKYVQIDPETGRQRSPLFAAGYDGTKASYIDGAQSAVGWLTDCCEGAEEVLNKQASKKVGTKVAKRKAARKA